MAADEENDSKFADINLFSISHKSHLKLFSIRFEFDIHCEKSTILIACLNIAPKCRYKNENTENA